MAKLGKDKLMTIKVLHETGEPMLQIAQRLSVDESTVRYHLKRMASGVPDGRVKPALIDRLGLEAAVRNWWAAQQEELPQDRSPNAEALL